MFKIWKMGRCSITKWTTNFCILMLIQSVALAQYTNSSWVFGDSCGFKFNSQGIDSTFITSVNARGTCASISDTAGNLLFYASSPDYNIWNSFNYERGAVYNKNHSVMQNGLYIKTSAWYHEMVILPDPGLPNEYYLFTAGVTSTTNPGLRYSKIDLNQNGGLGAVTTKNVMLDVNPINDGLLAIQHGNGRDWWLVYKHSDFISDTIQTYLITTTGIQPMPGQKIGSNVESSAYRFVINPAGNLIAGVSMYGRLELFDFDRCTGLFSNHRFIRQAPSGSTDEKDNFWSGAFSASGRYLYIATADYTSYLFQFDLLSPNIFSSRLLLDSIDIPLAPASALERGPDNRIYRSIAWNSGVAFNYPYPDTAWNMYNTHLSVINFPDSGGLACDYQPFSVYLPGCRTYLGLPNNPDYTLGRLTGSPCDTLSTSVNELVLLPKEQLIITPNPFKTTVKISLQSHRIYPYLLTEIYSIDGRKIEKHRFVDSETMEMDLESLEAGVYIVKVSSENTCIYSRIIKAE